MLSAMAAAKALDEITGEIVDAAYRPCTGIPVTKQVTDETSGMNPGNESLKMGTGLYKESPCPREWPEASAGHSS